MHCAVTRAVTLSSATKANTDTRIDTPYSQLRIRRTDCASIVALPSVTNQNDSWRISDISDAPRKAAHVTRPPPLAGANANAYKDPTCRTTGSI